MTDEQEYYAHVEALFTKPFLTEEELLLNLTRYWPGETSDTLQGLLELGLIERSPTGRYRLPLTDVLLTADTAPFSPQQAIPAPVATSPASAPHQPVKSAPAPFKTAPAPSSLKPLRLTRPALAA